MIIILAGPCGVGKSTIAPRVAKKKNIACVEFDEVKKAYPNEICFWSSRLNLQKCLSIILMNQAGDFILDIGGDTVFRNGVDNEHRLQELFCLKKNIGLKIIVLVASEDILQSRYYQSPKSKFSQGKYPYGIWKKDAEVYWFQCADKVIDTTLLSIDEEEEIIYQFL